MADMRERRVEESAAAAASDACAPLQLAFGYTFRDPSLLHLALLHRSFIYEASGTAGSFVSRSGSGKMREGRNPPGSDNEQLEFLGDAVLGLVITELLYAEFPERSEGELTRMRAALVSRDRLAELAVRLGLEEHLRLGRSAEEAGARTKPSVLADTAEAVLAAVYLDSRGAGRGAGDDSLSAVRTLVRNELFVPALDELRQALQEENGRGAFRDFKTLLQERVQAGKAGRLLYVDVAEEGPPHQRRFTVEARLEADEKSAVLAKAEGGSKKEAQQRAAESALAAWPLSALVEQARACTERNV